MYGGLYTVIVLYGVTVSNQKIVIVLYGVIVSVWWIGGFIAPCSQQLHWILLRTVESQ